MNNFFRENYAPEACCIHIITGVVSVENVLFQDRFKQDSLRVGLPVNKNASYDIVLLIIELVSHPCYKICQYVNRPGRPAAQLLLTEGRPSDSFREVHHEYS